MASRAGRCAHGSPVRPPIGAAVAGPGMPNPLVVVEYRDLQADLDLSHQLLEAWGEGGLGIIGIRGVPGWTETYSTALRLSHALAHLPRESLQRLEDENSLFNAGWSHGKEKLGDKPDFAKGSFYFNPLSDLPGTEEQRRQLPWALPPNRWPQELPELEAACKALGRCMHEAVSHVARLVDRSMRGRVPGYSQDLGCLIRETEKCKGRLLYYFPPAQGAAAPKAPARRRLLDWLPCFEGLAGRSAANSHEAVPEDGWIAWHNDSGYFTALTPDIYIDDDTGQVIDNPDPTAAGLWVVTRDGSSSHVTIPRDCMCVQVGECVQVVTGGLLVATPHCVRSCRPSLTKGRRVARASCPCFVDAHPAQQLKMPAGARREEVLARGLSTKVPPLGERWTHDGQTFGDFLGESFRRYYDWAVKAGA